MKYVGLTDEPRIRRKKHGSPADWWQTPFRSEREAKQWKGDLLTVPGYRAEPSQDGWRYGYTFTAPASRSR
ncbi:MAG: hypothetical protein ACYS5V_03160 [Planctomycetota bacterium]|jgi:hypothetical protein